MKKGLHYFSKSMVYLMGFAALSICLILLPELVREDLVNHPGAVSLDLIFLAICYLLATPFFIALYQTHKLISWINHGEAFSAKSVGALRNIKYCTIAFTVMFVLALAGGIALIKLTIPDEDMAGFGPIGFVITLVSSTIATFVAVLERVLQEALDMKQENDLTV